MKWARGEGAFHLGSDSMPSPQFQVMASGLRRAPGHVVVILRQMFQVLAKPWIEVELACSYSGVTL
jgi:hypothetical protein